MGVQDWGEKEQPVGRWGEAGRFKRERKWWGSQLLGSSGSWDAAARATCAGEFLGASGRWAVGGPFVGRALRQEDRSPAPGAPRAFQL